MSLLVIGNTSSNFALEIPKLRRTSEGLDEVRELVRLTTQTSIAQGSARSPGYGITGSFWVSETQTVGCQFGKYVVEVISKGLAGSKPVIYEGTGYSDTATGVFGGIPGAGGFSVKASVTIPRVGINARYLTTSPPSQSQVGDFMTPGQNYGVPAYPLTVADQDKVFHYPYGWYLAKRTVTPIPFTPYYLVVDEFIFQPSPTYGS
jgi:hypothetical protein